MVLTPEGERVIRDLAWQLEGIDGTVKIRRSPVYVESERVAYIDLARPPGELWGWRNVAEHTFVKCFDWEFVRPRADYLLEIPDWVCFELKWLDQDQFGHWSDTGFQKDYHQRKRREWELFHAVGKEDSLPAEVVRVESPEGVHVIDHLRNTYTSLRLYGTAGPNPDSPTGVADARSSPEEGRDGLPPRLPAQSAATVPRPTYDEEVTSLE
jgi:hypothetical protein